jgi:hypothetical protein
MQLHLHLIVKDRAWPAMGMNVDRIVKDAAIRLNLGRLQRFASSDLGKVDSSFGYFFAFDGSIASFALQNSWTERIHTES